MVGECSTPGILRVIRKNKVFPNKPGGPRPRCDDSPAKLTVDNDEVAARPCGKGSIARIMALE